MFHVKKIWCLQALDWTLDENEVIMGDTATKLHSTEDFVKIILCQCCQYGAMSIFKSGYITTYISLEKSKGFLQMHKPLRKTLKKGRQKNLTTCVSRAFLSSERKSWKYHVNVFLFLVSTRTYSEMLQILWLKSKSAPKLVREAYRLPSLQPFWHSSSNYSSQHLYKGRDVIFHNLFG